MKGFMMDLETAERFYRLCILWNLDTEEERMILMNYMIHHDNIKILTDVRLKKMLEGKKIMGIENEKRQDTI